MPEFEETLAEHGIEYDIANIEQQLTEAQLSEILNKYDGILAGDDELTAEVIQSAPRLKVISKWGIGTDNIDTEAATNAGVTVTNTPDLLGPEVADVVIGYAVMLTRDLHKVDREVRNGNWFTPRGESLLDMTVGIVGVGDIGSQVTHRFNAFGTDLIGYDIEPVEDDLKTQTGIERVSLQELLSKADMISLNCPLTEETSEMIGKDALDRLGEDGYLINTSRGKIVDQDALISALQNEEIAGAALDVYEKEPLPSENQLTDLENVVLGTHNAQNTHQAVSRVNEKAVHNLIDGII
ncbi:MAG: phosphoglycerate dehydrogenase, partial [Candidatus Paceibacteria bacterium]